MTEHLTATRAGERFAVAIAAATDCHQACIEALSWGLQQRGEPAHLLHARLMLDCAQVCATSADFMARASAHHARVCGVCAEVCRACAASCRELDGMEDCVAACEACAASCEAMAA